MAETAHTPDFDLNEQHVDQVVAACGGDIRAALKALIIANGQLEAELQVVTCAVSYGYVQGRLRKAEGDSVEAHSREPAAAPRG
jgi:hypothetical protein